VARKLKVNLTKYVRTAKGLRYCPAVISTNGRIKPEIVIVGAKEERHAEGSYYLDWNENGKRIRQSIGKNAADAYTQYQRKTFSLNASAHGVNIVPEANGRKPLAVAVADFLDETKLSKKPTTLAVYRTAIRYFQESCTKQFVEEIERKDLIKFAALLRDDKDQSPRSVYNKFENLMTFLKASGVRGLIGKNDWPRYVEEEPEIYEESDINTLFAACDSRERARFEFFLMTGEREQEVMHTYWSDINFNSCTVRVTHKPDLGWTPKAYKEREIPVPEKLIASLQVIKPQATRCELVFPTTGCRPKLDFLDCLKAVAKRANLNPEDFWLHKFRATFASWALWEGTDLRTVQHWLGHSDIESTMRYLNI
jgi:integrase/recombinase XerD